MHQNKNSEGAVGGSLAVGVIQAITDIAHGEDTLHFL